MESVLVKDREQLDKFIQLLPELKVNQCYYFVLLARSKYDKSVKYNSSKCDEFVAHKRTDITNKISKIEANIHNHTNQDGTPISSKALVLYAHVTPRSFKIANQIMTRIALEHCIHDQHSENPISLAKSSLSKAKGSVTYVHLNFDTTISAIEIMKEVETCINLSAVTIVSTMGGYHLLIDKDKIKSEYTNSWHHNLAGCTGFGVGGDMLLPVPGCNQGGWIPRILN